MKTRARNYKKLNSHINFKLEGSKGNARKDETKVRCVECGVPFSLPFKPRNPEVYCNLCFKSKKKKNTKKN